INGRHIGAGDAVVFEVLVERLDAHGEYAFGNEIADRVIGHCASNAGPELEAVRKVGSDVKFSATHVNVATRRFAERDDSRIQTMDQGAKGQEVERAAGGDV